MHLIRDIDKSNVSPRFHYGFLKRLTQRPQSPHADPAQGAPHKAPPPPAQGGHKVYAAGRVGGNNGSAKSHIAMWLCGYGAMWKIECIHLLFHHIIG